MDVAADILNHDPIKVLEKLSKKDFQMYWFQNIPLYHLQNIDYIAN